MGRTTTAQLRRLDLIEAVLKILATEGWDRLTVRRVAAESNVSPGAMPHFIGTKGEMVTEAIRHGFRTYQSRIQRAIAGSATPTSRLHTWLASTVMPPEDSHDEWGFWLCMWGRIPFDETIRQDLAPVYRVHAAAVKQIILDGMADGSFEPCLDPETLSDQLVALIDGLMMRCRLDPEFTPDRVHASVTAFADQLVIGHARERDSGTRPRRDRPDANGRTRKSRALVKVGNSMAATADPASRPATDTSR